MENTIKFSDQVTLPITKIKFFDGNRDVVERHVNKMYSLIEENGFPDTIKVAKISGKYFAVEGQHRLEALARHGVEKVPCSVIDWLGNDFDEIQSYIIDLNAHNKAWSLYDYVKSWAGKKIPEYVHLQHKMQTYQQTLSNGVVATIYDGVVRSHIAMKAGKLKFFDKEFSDELADFLSGLVAKWGKKRLPAQVLRNAASKIISRADGRRRVMRAFGLATTNLLSLADQPMPDGDDAFAYWFDNTVMEFYKTIK